MYSREKNLPSQPFPPPPPCSPPPLPPDGVLYERSSSDQDQRKEKRFKMAVDTVKIEADAYMVCLTHALSTEREEVMGLLIGEVQYLFTRFIWKIFRGS